jgi:hypothetical protein
MAAKQAYQSKYLTSDKLGYGVMYDVWGVSSCFIFALQQGMKVSGKMKWCDRKWVGNS